MKTAHLISSLLLSTLLAGMPLFAEDPKWDHTVIKDPLTGKTMDRFTLVGEYLAQPSGGLVTSTLRKGEVPKLVLLCANGKLVSEYGLLRAGMIQNTSTAVGAKIDTVIDRGIKKTVSTEVGYTSDRNLTDADTQQFTAFELGNVLKELLHGKIVTLVVREDRSTSSSLLSSAPRQVQMEFRIPEPTPLITSCGEDRVIKTLNPSVIH